MKRKTSTRRSLRINRRSVLRGISASIAMPWLEIMSPQSVSAAPSEFSPWPQSSLPAPVPRSIFCYVPNGVNIHQWVPQDSGRDYTLSPSLQSLADYREAFTVISGIGHVNARGGHTGADTWLTGAALEAVAGRAYTNTISVDQLIADTVGVHTRFRSLELSDSGGTGNAGHSHTLAFDRNGVPIPTESSPRRLFNRLFVADTGVAREIVLRRYAEQRSILDEVLGEANQLMGRLGQADRERLEQYLSAVRETETHVERLENWVDVERPDIDDSRLQLTSMPGDLHDRPAWLDVMLEIAYLAFATDTTRVISFEWSREAGGFGPNGENHHELSHHGGDSDMLERLAGIDRFHVGRLARFMGLLAGTKEGDASMLDQTMIMFGSGMNNGSGGDHSPDNLPLLVAGGNSLGLRHGSHIAFDPDDHPPMSNLLLSLMQKMGLEAERFQDSEGVLAGLI